MRGVHGFGITFRRKIKNTPLRSSKDRNFVFYVRHTFHVVHVCVPTLTTFPSAEPKKKKRKKVCTLSKRFNLRAPVFTRECKRFRSIAFRFFGRKKKELKDKGRMYTCVYICVSGAVYTPTRLLSVTGRRAGFCWSLSTADPPAPPSVPHFYVMYLQEEGGVGRGGGRRNKTTTSTSRLYAHQFVNTCKIY